MRILLLSVILTITFASFSQQVLAQSYSFTSGVCVNVVRYETSSEGYLRDDRGLQYGCMQEQNERRLSSSSITGYSKFEPLKLVLGMPNTPYSFAKGRIPPDKVGLGLEAMAFGLLELHMRYTYQIDAERSMKDNLDGARFQFNRQINANRSSASEADKFSRFLGKNASMAVEDLDSLMVAALPSSDRRIDAIEGRLREASIPLPDLTPTLNEADGPVLSRLSGQSPEIPKFEQQVQALRQSLSTIPRSSVQEQALKILAYASEEAETSLELAEALYRQAQALRFVAEGKLPLGVANPNELIGSYLDFRKVNSVFEDKYATLEALLTTLKPQSIEELRARESLSISEALHETGAAERAEGNFFDAKNLTDIAVQILDIGLGFTPGVGTGKDLYELFVGKSLLTGEMLDTTARVLSGVSVVTAGVLNSGVMKTVVKKVGPTLSRVSIPVLNRLIDIGDDLMRQMGGIGVQSSSEMRKFVTNPLGRLWAKVRINLNYFDGIGPKAYRRAPPNSELLPSQNLFAHALSRNYADDFMFKGKRLKAPGEQDVLITPFNDIADHLSFDGLARRLTLLDKGTASFRDIKASDYVVLQFSLKGDFWSLLSERTAVLLPDTPNGWIPLGRTQGGAAEFVIGNVPLNFHFIDPDSIKMIELTD